MHIDTHKEYQLADKFDTETVAVQYLLKDKQVSIYGVQCHVETVDGIDISPNSILQGVSFVNGNIVTQLYTGGLPGCTYQINTMITYNDGTIKQIESYLPVIRV